jgi:hypothetical protein
MSAPRRAPARPLSARLVRAALALLLALTTLALAPAARAEGPLLVEPGTDLRLRLDVPGAHVCVVVPRESQRAEDCEDLNLPALEAMVNGEKDAPTGIALVQFPSWSFSVMVSSQRDLAPSTAEQIEGYTQGVAQGAAASFDSVKIHGKNKGAPYDLESINGIHAIRFQVDLSAPKDPKADPIRLDYGALVGRRGLALVAVVVDPKHAAEAEPMVRSILATASMPHPEIAHFGEHGGVFGEPLAVKIAEALGALVALVLLFALFRRGSLKKAPAPR